MRNFLFTRAVIFGVLLMLLSLGPRQVFAQLAQQAIRAKAETYLDATERGDWEAVVDMLYPKLFELSSREEVMATMKNMESSGFKVDIRDAELLDISEVRTFEKLRYARLAYRMTLWMQLAGPDWDNEEVVDMIKKQFETIYGSENVTYTAAEKVFQIKARNTMLALLDEDATEWSFLEYNDTLGDFLVQILGQGMVDHLAAEKN